MGLFAKLKSLISKKEKIVEEVKEEYQVDDISKLEESSSKEIKVKEVETPEEELTLQEDENIEVEEIEESEESIVTDDGQESIDDELPLIEDTEEDEIEVSVDEDETLASLEDEDEVPTSEDTEEDEEWAKFIKEHNDKKSKVEEAEEITLYDKGLEKTRKEFVSKLSLLGIKYTKVSEEYFDELEELLINADVGVNTVMNFMDRLRERIKSEKITDTAYLNEVIVDELFIIYVDNESLSDKINMAESGPTVILMVGVNGVGKTTTIAKLAHKYINDGKKVMMIAGDTFRAGAVKQLEEWATRTGASFFGKENTDPAGVIFDGLVKAKEENADIVLIDTAGRLQNKVNLMKELEKVNKVIERHIEGAPHETLLVIDATTGQNGISQANAFKEITNITGIVLTKLDGTAKGGIVLAIKEEVKIPVKFIGLGEGMKDLKTFDIENYIYGLFKDMM